MVWLDSRQPPRLFDRVCGAFAIRLASTLRVEHYLDC